LFNHILAQRLGVPYVLLGDSPAPEASCPLISLKFEELDVPQRQLLLACCRGHRFGRGYSLFLHTLTHSEAEQQIIRQASVVFCGNDWIYRTLREQDACCRLVNAFAPTLIPESYRRNCRPARVECFYFGMAGKVDRGRLVRLRDLLDEVQTDYRVVCSLAIHQTSDGSCVPLATEFLGSCFGERFIYLGTLTDMGIAYFLNSDRVFVGFYPRGARSNNTTLNTALGFGRKIISNLDRDSPAELQRSPRVLNLDTADALALQMFLHEESGTARQEEQALFSWDELVHLVLEPFAAGAGLAA
jgi:hypothetical protein